MVPITGGTAGLGLGVAAELLAVRRTPPSGCWPSEWPTSRPSPTVQSPIVTITREEMTIGTTPFLPLVVVGRNAVAGSSRTEPPCPIQEDLDRRSRIATRVQWIMKADWAGNASSITPPDTATAAFCMER